MPTIKQIKEQGVVYTPQWIVEYILNLSKFNNNIYDKSVMEPSCGDGAFLKEITRRIIIDALNNKINPETISDLLSKNIHGVDIDADAVSLCKANLTAICHQYNIPTPIWRNIIVANGLSPNIYKHLLGQLDFVFGNPPYVRIQNLDKKTRRDIKNNFNLCQHGSTDIYIAFYELGIKLLKPTGKLGYITPNTFLKSAAGKALRGFLYEKKNVEALVDFEHHQVFDNVMTYSLIAIINNAYCSYNVELYKGNSSEIKYDNSLNIESFGSGNWILKTKSIIDKINHIRQIGTPLCKIAKIHTGIATLADNLFIFNKPFFSGSKAIITLKDGRVFEIEKELLKKTIKASTWRGEDQGIFSLFPYKKVNGKHVIIPEEELSTNFPLTYKYLLSVKDELIRRDKGKPNPISWYAYGRSQGLDTCFGKKIITAAINLKPRFIVCEEEDTLYYAGYSVVYTGNLHQLAKKLNSEEMMFFIEHTSRDYQNGYKSYAKAFIKDFGITL